MRPCIERGCPELTRQTRCAAHERVRNAIKNSRRGTPSQRGYTASYRAARQRLLAVATACAWCGLPPTLADPLQADHLVPTAQGGSLADGLVPAHRSCNARRGQLITTQLRKARMAVSGW